MRHERTPLSASARNVQPSGVVPGRRDVASAGSLLQHHAHGADVVNSRVVQIDIDQHCSRELVHKLVLAQVCEGLVHCARGLR